NRSASTTPISLIRISVARSVISAMGRMEAFMARPRLSIPVEIPPSRPRMGVAGCKHPDKRACRDSTPGFDSELLPAKRPIADLPARTVFGPRELLQSRCFGGIESPTLNLEGVLP